ncbi:hypothetical protein [Marinomonas algicola]|uniref:hypothetical protein n=1 Tax=Marinomonas algicola TaxID=2773454 RepID=UPI00174E585C|nr:hypothetical protein [Marinomonas algicola]
MMDTQIKYDALLAQWGYDGSEFKYTKKAYAFTAKYTKSIIKLLIKARISATKSTISNRLSAQF